MKQDRTQLKDCWKWLRKRFSRADRWLIMGVLVAVGFIGYGLYQGLAKMQARLSPTHEVTLEATPVDIESIRPRGELYLCTAVAEDYATLQRTRAIAGLFPQHHACVQMVKQKVGYRIDLEKIVYETDTLHTLIVTLPDVEYVVSTQESPFMSDDESFWSSDLESTNKLKYKAEMKIRKRFDTPENRKKARRYAEESIRYLLMQLGYDVRFTPQLEERKMKGRFK